MTICVTGGTGFIGRHLVIRLLERGHDVRALTRGGKPLPSDVAAVAGDLAEMGVGDMEDFLDGADVLIHCAGEIQDADRMEALHIAATSRLVEAATCRVRRWVQLSSTGVYGPVRTGTVTEQTPPAPVGPYETTKANSDRIVVEAATGGAFECVVLRPSIVFGADMTNGALRQMARVIQRGWFVFVGTSGASANYVHVDDVAAALVLCAERPEAEGVYNLSGWTTMEVFIGAMAEGMGVLVPARRLPENVVRLAGRLGDYVPGVPLTTSRVDALTNRVRYSTERIETGLGYAPGCPLAMSVAAAAGGWVRP